MFSKSDCEESMHFFGLGYLITLLLIYNRLKIVAFLLKTQQYQKIFNNNSF